MQLMCEACGKKPAEEDDVLCLICGYYYKIVLGLVADPESVHHIKEIIDWRVKKNEDAVRSLSTENTPTDRFRTDNLPH